MIMATAQLAGLKVLVLEDNALVAMHLEEMLGEAGCEVVATIDTVGRALEFIRNHPVDAAVLDVNLKGEKVFGVAEELMARNVPFVFSSGYGERFLPPQFDAAPHLSKPFEPETLWQTLAQACAAKDATNTSDSALRG
jgi:CheY-like chemotaxis protein